MEAGVSRNEAAVPPPSWIPCNLLARSVLRDLLNRLGTGNIIAPATGDLEPLTLTDLRCRILGIQDSSCDSGNGN